MHFFDLSRELRDSIYELILCQRGRGGRCMPTRKTDSRHQLSLFATCRKIFTEAHPIYYGRNIFFFNRSSNLTHFLEQIGERGRTHVRAISLAPTAETIFHRVQFRNTIAKLPQLEHLELRLYDNYRYELEIQPWKKTTPRKIFHRHDYSWVIALSGLSLFKVKLDSKRCNQFVRAHEGERCRCCKCDRCRSLYSLAASFQNAARSYVYQPRASYMMSPKYVELEASAAREVRRRLFLEEKRKFEERMEWELKNLVKMALHEELRNLNLASFVERCLDGGAFDPLKEVRKRKGR
jgi:hypothetical protein